MKLNSSDFQHQISLYIIYSNNKFRFSTNYQNVQCSILSQLGLTNKLAFFLEGLRSYDQVKRKKLAEEYNYFSLIFKNSVILSPT